MDFTSLPPSIIDDLYEEPAKLEVLTFDDFLNLPLNDLYLKENGNDPASAIYKPKVEDVPIVTVEEIVESKPETIEHEVLLNPTERHNVRSVRLTMRCISHPSVLNNIVSSLRVDWLNHLRIPHRQENGILELLRIHVPSIFSVSV